MVELNANRWEWAEEDEADSEANATIEAGGDG
jgi:hypothetical protein